jgi:secondary thiamine-phosphate synthase enzyme
MASKVHQETISIATRSRGGSSPGRHAFVDATDAVGEVVARSGVKSGVVNVFIQHTSASLVIQENADPRVLDDLDAWIRRVAPESTLYSHDDEGPDDMPGHLRAAVTKTHEMIPLKNGQLALGTWQALYVWEHRARPHQRKLVVTVMGDS